MRTSTLGGTPLLVAECHRLNMPHSTVVTGMTIMVGIVATPMGPAVGKLWMWRCHSQRCCRGRKGRHKEGHGIPKLGNFRMQGSKGISRQDGSGRTNGMGSSRSISWQVVSARNNGIGGILIASRGSSDLSKLTVLVHGGKMCHEVGKSVVSSWEEMPNHAGLRKQAAFGNNGIADVSNHAVSQGLLSSFSTKMGIFQLIKKVINWCGWIPRSGNMDEIGLLFSNGNGTEMGMEVGQNLKGGDTAVAI